MRNILIALFSIICLTGVSAQLNNTWQFAWQNAPIGNLCIPESISITIDDTTNVTNVTYSYDSATQSTNCPSTPLTQSNLTVSPTDNNTYTDSANNTIVFVNTTVQSVQFTLNGSNLTFFYLNTQDSISEPVTLGTLGAIWSSPSLSSGDSCTCAPDYLFVLPFPVSTSNLEYSSFYTSSDCSTNISEALNQTGSTAVTINWVSTSNISFAYTPSVSSSNITYTYYNSTNQSSCVYTYQRNLTTSGLLNNSWVPDWQDSVAFAANISTYPSQYSVFNNNNTYMTTTYTLGGQNASSYLVQNLNGQYQDAYLNQVFTYDQPTNTLTTTSSDFLYSQNGSLFNATQFVEFWGTPTTASADNCCIFTYANITQNPTNNNTLNVVYTPPEGYTNASSPCNSFSAAYANGVLTSTLNIEQPSITGLTWVDQTFNTTISFAGNASTIAIQFPGQCSINMVVTAPPPPPAPTPNPQFNQQWQFAWQNPSTGNLCIPEYITIATDNTTNVTNVTYSYNAATQAANCPTNVLTSSNLTVSQGNTSAVTDSAGNIITYTNATVQSIQFTNSSSTFFYLNTQDYIPEAATLGTLGAYWNSSFLTSGNAAVCTCAPDYLFVLPFQVSTANLKYYSFYTSSNCSTNTSETLSETGSTASTINWVSPTSVSFAFTPSVSSSNITFTYSNSTNQCVYSYQRNLNTSGLLNNSWVPDWQDSFAFNSTISTYPSYYSVSNNNNTYMTTTYTLNGQSVSSYLVQNLNGQYQDAYLNQAFTYDQPTNTLTTSSDFLYSQSGSLFNATQFVEFWGKPSTAGTTDNCCIFTYVNITQNTTDNNTLNVVYTPPEGYTDSSSPCSDFHTDYANGVLESTLNIEQPSITGLTWVDQIFNTTISFVNGSSSTVAVQFPGQCSINMVVTQAPGPAPLAGNWFSTKALGLIMGLFVVLACM